MYNECGGEETARIRGRNSTPPDPDTTVAHDADCPAHVSHLLLLVPSTQGVRFHRQQSVAQVVEDLHRRGMCATSAGQRELLSVCLSDLDGSDAGCSREDDGRRRGIHAAPSRKRVVHEGVRARSSIRKSARRQNGSCQFRKVHLRNQHLQKMWPPGFLRPSAPSHHGQGRCRVAIGVRGLSPR